jgi:Homeodomain-like domain
MSTELEVRNRAIYRLYASGKSVQDIADQHGITRQRVAQIIARYGAVGVSDDESRTLMRTQLEYLASEMISVVRNGPAPAVNVKGEIIYDANGQMVFDYSGVISAADTARKVSESIRRLDALDLPRRKQMIEDEAMKRARAYLALLPQAEVVEE